MLKKILRNDIKNNNRHFKVVLLKKFIYIYDKLNKYFIEIHAIWMYYFLF